MQRLGRSLSQWLGFFLETDCPLCQRSTPRVICPPCQRQLQQCQLPTHQPASQSPTIWAWGAYQGALRRAIAAFKYHQHPELAQPLADLLTEAWFAHQGQRQRLTVVPIPIHSSKRQQRGFNQAELLAQHFCHRTHLTLAGQGLERARATEAQFGLSAADRDRNLEAAFTLGPTFCRRAPTTPVLLLDDIYTSGATVRAASRVLQQHQIPVHGVIVLARAIRQTPHQ